MKTVNTPDRADDRIASYSSKGPTLYDHVVKPDILAPGNQVRSLLSSNTSTLFTSHPVTQVPVAYYATGYSTISAKYANLSGTSMATPVVSGAAALLIQQNPALTPDQVKARLMKTAYKSFPASSTAMDSFTGTSYNSYYDIFTVGAGYLDIAAALMNSDLASGNALSPVAVYNAATNTGTISFAPSSTWSNSVIWGTGVTWGTNVMSGSSVIWGSSVSWGTSVIWGSTQGFSVLWGTGHCGSGIGIGMGFGNECIDPAGVIWGSNTAIQDMAVLTLGEN